MKFNRLEASIQNNAGTNPTIYMALCMVEALFKDIQDESGVYIYDCPVGDETLPTRLVSLCRIINQIYTNKNGELERNRTRLDKMMQQLADTEEKLATLSGIPGQIAETQKKLGKAQAELKTRQENQKECQRLESQCAKMRAEIEMLRQYDPDKAQGELNKLEAEAHKLKDEQAELGQQYRTQKTETEALRQQVEELKKAKKKQELAKAGYDKQITELQNSLDELNSEINRLQTCVPQLQTEITQATAKRDSIQQDVEEIQREWDRLNAEVQKLEAYKTALDGQIDTLNKVIDKLDVQLKSLQGQLQEKKQEKNDKDAQIVNLQGDIKQTERDIADKEKRLKACTDDYTKVCVRVKRLGVLIEEQEEQTKAYHENVLAPEEQRLQDAKAKYAQVQQDKAAKEQSWRKLEKEVKDDTITISVIKDDIDKLKGDRNTKQAELDAEKQKKETIEKECERLDDEHKALVEQLGALQTEVRRLNEIKIPEVNAALEKERKRKQQQETKLGELAREKDELVQKNTQTADELERLKADVQVKNEDHQKLTAKYDAKTAELESLVKQEAELKDKTDDEQLRVYQQHLQGSIKNLENIQQETDEVKKELEKQQKALEDAKSEKEKLEQKIAELEQNTNAIREKKFALTKKLTEPELLQQLEETCQQLKTLEAARSELTKAINTMEKALGRSFSMDISLDDLDDLKEELNALCEAAKQIQDALKGCADCVNNLELEER